MISINSNTRQFIIPGSDVSFGVEFDSGTERKYFQCPRYVGDNLDIASCFVRINYRNANGETDFYLVDDLTVDGNNIIFSWVLSPKVTAYKGLVKFVMCVVGPDLKLKWHTTQGSGQIYEGMEPDNSHVESDTADVVAQLIAMVESQTAAVTAEGSKQIKAVQTAATSAQTASVAEIEAKGTNTRNSIPADYTALSKTVDSLVRSKAGAIVCEAAGSVIEVNDASDMPIQSMRIFGRSTQNGTPTPTDPVEIVSVESPKVTVAGKNLLDTASLTAESEYHGIKAKYEGDGIFRLYGTVTSTQTTSHLTTELSIPIHPDKNYTLCAEIVSGGITGITRIHPYLGIGTAPGNRMNWLAAKVDSSSPVGSVAYNTAKAVAYNPEAKFITRFWIYFAQPTVGDVVDVRIRLWLTQSDVPEAYEPYVGHTATTTHPLRGIPVTSGGNYTDSNGQQWICDEVDLERGVYVQRLLVSTITDFSKAGVAAPVDGHTEGSLNLGTSLAMNTGICDKFAYVQSGYRNRFAALSTGGLYFMIAGEYTADEWRSEMSKLSPTVVLPLATAIEIPLSETEIAAYRTLHSNYQNTTVFNDAGAHMVVKYAADTKLYIDKKIKEALQ